MVIDIYGEVPWTQSSGVVPVPCAQRMTPAVYQFKQKDVTHNDKTY